MSAPVTPSLFVSLPGPSVSVIHRLNPRVRDLTTNTVEYFGELERSRVVGIDRSLLVRKECSPILYFSLLSSGDPTPSRLEKTFSGDSRQEHHTFVSDYCPFTYRHRHTVILK